MNKAAYSDGALVDKVVAAVSSAGDDGDWRISTVAAEYVNAAATVLGNDNHAREHLREALRGRTVHRRVELPSNVATEIERKCAERCCPQVERHGCGSRTFVIPPWFRVGGLSRSIRVTLDRAGHCTEVVATPSQRGVPLWPHADYTMNHTYPRRSRHYRWAERMRAQLSIVLGNAPSAASDWLDSFEQMDAAALSVWTELVESIDMPRPLRSWSPRIGDLCLCATPERRRFATHWPWAAVALSRGDGHVRRRCLRRLDDNVANSIHVASKMLCCESKEGCEKALGVAQQMPRIPLATQRVALGHGPRVDPTYRALLFEAGNSGRPMHALLRQCDPQLVKAQVEYARSVVFALRCGDAARLAVGGLLAQMLVGTDIPPADSGAEPAAVACAFRRASAECLAVFAAESEHRPAEEDELGAGVFALAGYFRQKRLKFQQLVRWSAAVAPHGDALFEGDRAGAWAPPPGWEAHMAQDGAVTPLLSIADIMHEGSVMDNCLARGFYHERAAAGDVHIFRLPSPGRATLALKEHRAMSDAIVTHYSVVELKSVQNRRPSAGAARRSELLVTALNSKTPIVVPDDELERRRKSTRSFNVDRHVATEVWRQLFAPALPGRLRGSSPLEIAATMPPR